MSKDEATRLLEAAVNLSHAITGLTLTASPRNFIENDRCWGFYVTSREYLQTNNISYQVMVPAHIVDKVDGAVVPASRYDTNLQRAIERYAAEKRGEA